MEEGWYKEAHMLFFLLRFCILSSILALCGCSSSRRVQPIEVPVAPIECAIIATDPNLIDEQTIPLRWWELFNDEQLNCLILEGLANNPTYQASKVKILYACSAAAVERSKLLPTVTYGADVSRQKFSETGIIP